jgi:hypothetical protein
MSIEQQEVVYYLFVKLHNCISGSSCTSNTRNYRSCSYNELIPFPRLIEQHIYPIYVVYNL